ncbi:MAG: tyrosine-type recombinase/integrase [Acidimicrobiales bacterium]
MDPINARRSLDRLCAEAGIGHRNLNALGHSSASLMSRRGAPIGEVADAMGHVVAQMTSRVYRHNLTSVVEVAAIYFGSITG